MHFRQPHIILLYDKPALPHLICAVRLVVHVGIVIVQIVHDSIQVGIDADAVALFERRHIGIYVFVISRIILVGLFFAVHLNQVHDGRFHGNRVAIELLFTTVDLGALFYHGQNPPQIAVHIGQMLDERFICRVKIVVSGDISVLVKCRELFAQFLEASDDGIDAAHHKFGPLVGRYGRQQFVQQIVQLNVDAISLLRPFHFGAHLDFLFLAEFDILDI